MAETQKNYLVKRSCGHKEKLIMMVESAVGDKIAAAKQECWDCWEEKKERENDYYA